MKRTTGLGRTGWWRTRLAGCACALALAALTGCVVAPAGAPPTSAAPPANVHGGSDVPVPGQTPVPTTTTATTVRPAAAVVDSGPSPEAIEVLDSIREPLRPEERTPAPAASGEVPVPSETVPLGDRPGPDPVDSLAVTGPVSPDTSRALQSLLPPGSSPAPGSGAAPGAGDPGGTAPPAHTGPCWRVQLGAPDNAEEAEQVRAAAVSLLIVHATVEKEGGLFKVRTAECLDRDSAARLRERAVSSGFDGAFLVKTESP